MRTLHQRFIAPAAALLLGACGFSPVSNSAHAAGSALQGKYEVIAAGSHMDMGTGVQDAQGTSLTYTFESDGDYRLEYTMYTTSGLFQTGMEITEVGRYSRGEKTIEFKPRKYEGYVYNHSVANKTDLKETRVPPRTYHYMLSPDGKVLVMMGECPSYQADPYCETWKGGKSTKNTVKFGFQRAD